MIFYNSLICRGRVQGCTLPFYQAERKSVK
nr:MAG TPA: hypothetical protein [Caudoviricetes sp.]